MSSPRRPWLAAVFAMATLCSAFLVFQVQPVISKAVLPWFGGSPAVWTTCMLFFQVLLFAGYAYAHFLATYCRPRWQGVLHLAWIGLSLLVLPIVPAEDWKPTGSENPTWRILMILAVNVGLPYFLLSSTGPLLQAWFSRSCPGQSPYRLYALSNIGSLVALISYPFVVEPAWCANTQASVWSAGFCAFAVLCGLVVLGLGKCSAASATAGLPIENTATASLVESPTLPRQLTWLLLPGFASILLLATTNHVCQDVAVVPFLWVVPLSLYLVTFIICFDRESWYSRRWCTALALISILVLYVSLQFQRALPLVPEVAMCLSVMFFVCMICHGELVRSKPQPRYLTKFYLLTSAGGALGGILVALICPLLFTSHYELPLSVLAAIGLASGVGIVEFRLTWLARPQRQFLAILSALALFLFVARVQSEQQGAQPITAKRNFYGTLCVTRSETAHGIGTSLIHGRILHGFQHGDEKLRRAPTTYYAPQSGVGLALRCLRNDQCLRVGAVGLGCGTVAAFGRAGDAYCFYEINPAVVQVARENFSFLQDSPAQIMIRLGDARLSLEREPPQGYDVLVLDAFSGDSVPAHLLTKEAFAVYRHHLKTDGVIAVHVSNRHLRLEPVVIRQAEHLKMRCVQVASSGDQQNGVMVSKWMLITNNGRFLAQPEVARVAQSFSRRPGAEFPLWTDQYNNLFQILNAF